MKLLPRILLGAAVLLIPLAARFLWFNHGYYRPAEAAAMPDFSQATLPVPALSTSIPTPLAIAATGQTVLFDQQHGNLFNFSEIDSLVGEIQSLGAGWSVIQNDANLAQSLKRVDSFVVIAPTIPFSPQEISTVKGFTERGGRLLVINDPTRSISAYDSGMDTSMPSGLSSPASSTAVSNMLLNPFHLAFEDDYLYNVAHNEGNFRHIMLTDFAKSPLTTGLKEVVFYSTHSIKPDRQAVISANDGTLSSMTDAGGNLAAAAVSTDGQVTALGDLTFLASPYSHVADNQKLIQNLAAFLVKTGRPQELADFPYVFTRGVTVIHDEDMPFGSPLISEIAELQDNFKADGVAVYLADKPAAGSDLLVIGAFPPGKNIQDLIADFDITFTDEDADFGDSLNSPLNAAPEASKTPTPERTTTASAGPKTTPVPTSTEELPFPVLETPDESYFPLDDFSGESGSGGSMEIPGFGKVPTKGLSLILFQPSEVQNTLILLADGEDGLQALLTRLNSGDLTGCLLKENIALCGPSTGSDYPGIN
jgi:hypothetical protein